MALLALLGGAGSAWWGLTPSRGYLWPLPIELVTALIAVEANDDGLCGREVRMRLGAFSRPDGSVKRTATAEDGARVLRRAVRGVPGARPPSKRWQQSYAQFLRGYRFALYGTGAQGQVTMPHGLEGESPAELLAAVEEQRTLPYVLRVRTREVWPTGSEVQAEISIDHWWPTTRPYFRVSSPSHSGQLQYRMSNGQVMLKAFADGETELDLEIEVFNRGSLSDETFPEPAGRERRRLRFKVSGTLDEVLPPIESTRLDEIMKEYFRPSLGRLFLVDLDSVRAMSGLGFDGVGISVLMEVVHDGKVWTRHRARWVVGKSEMLYSGGKALPGYSEYLRAHSEGWTVRVLPEPETAILLLDATHSWRGSIEVPVEIGSPSPGAPRRTAAPLEGPVP